MEVIKIDAVKLEEDKDKLKKKKNVTAYCRVSTELEEQQSSYQEQQAYYSDYISKNPGWNFVGIYADEGISGTSLKKRDEFKRMMKDAKEGKIDYILVKSISRFARNTVDTLNCIRTLKNLHPPVGVYFEKENIDTLDTCSELILTIMSALAQDESRSISDNVKWTFQKKFERGEDVTNLNGMLGYEWGKDKEWLINEAQAEIVRYIYKRYLDGLGTTMIAKELMEKKQKTGRGKTTWRSGAVYKILTNEKYVGDAHLQKTIVRNIFSHTSERNDGSLPSYYVRDHHPAIIDRETWNAVQKEIKNRRNKKTVWQDEDIEPIKYYSKWPFSSKLRCGNCGGLLVRRTFRSSVKSEGENAEDGRVFSYPVWRCKEAEKGNEGNCKERSYMELALQQSFMEYIYDLRIRLRESVKNQDSEGNLFSCNNEDLYAWFNNINEEFFDECNEETDDNEETLESEYMMQLQLEIQQLELQKSELSILENCSAQIYLSMKENIELQLKEKTKEYQKIFQLNEKKKNKKEALECFLKSIFSLPEKNKAGQYLKINGMENKEKKGMSPKEETGENSEEVIADMLPFDEELFKKTIRSGTVLPDGRIIYQTRFGVSFSVSGNERRFAQFYNYRRVNEDGTPIKIEKAYQVTDSQLKKTDKSKKDKI